MAPPDTEALQEPPEDMMRRVAREEARAVYDELTATDADGESWSLRRLMDSFGLSRRQAIKALGLIAIGYTAPQAVARLFVGTARADAAGQSGTQADPLQDLFAHEIHAGDGSDVITGADAIQHANEAVSSATTIGNVTFVYYDSSVAGFTITIPASLEKDGIILYFIDTGGSAASNNVDVTSTNWNVDGAGSHTIDGSGGAYILFSHSGEWRSRIFTERVDAGTIATEQLTGMTAQVPQDVSGSRTFGTWETNNTGTWLVVTASISFSSTGNNGRIRAHTNTSQTDRIADEQQLGNNDSTNDALSVQMVVAPGNDYRVTVAGDTANISMRQWIEYKLGEA